VLYKHWHVSFLHIVFGDENFFVHFVAGNSSNSRWQFSSPQAAQKAASLLGTTVEELARVLFGSSSGGMGTPSTPRAPFRTPSPTEKGLDRDVTGLEALEGMIIGLYGEVLNAVAALINRWGLLDTSDSERV